MNLQNVPWRALWTEHAKSEAVCLALPVTDSQPGREEVVPFFPLRWMEGSKSMTDVHRAESRISQVNGSVCQM